MPQPTPEALSQAMAILLASMYEPSDSSPTHANDDSESALLRRKIQNPDPLQIFLKSEEFESRRLFNDRCVPINLLPVETVATILLIDLNNRWEEQSSVRNRRAELSLVCGRWSKVVSCFPSLWSDLSYEQQDVRTSLRQSKTIPLRIACRPIHGSDKFHSDINGFLRHTKDHMSRWSAVWFNVYQHARMVGRCLEQPTPALRDISVAFDSVVLSHRMINLQDGRTLRHVNLERTRLPWGSDRLRNLRSLELRHLEEGLPDLNDFRTILAASPLLERLALRDLIGTVTTEGAPSTDNTPIDLPALESLLLGDIPKALADFITQVVRPRALSSLVILNSHSSQFASNSPHSPLYNLTAPALRLQSTLRIVQESTNRVVLAGGTLPKRWKPWPYEETGNTFRVVFEDTYASTALPVIVSIVNACAPEATVRLRVRRTLPSTIEGVTPTDAELFPVSLLDRLPTLDAISVHDILDARAIMSHLGDSHVGDDGRVWPNPRLVSLSMEDVVGLTVEDVLDFSSRRDMYDSLDVYLPDYLES